MAQPDDVRLRYFQALRHGPLKDLRDLIHSQILPRVHEWLRKTEALRIDAPGDDDAGDLHDAFDRVAREWANKWSSKRLKVIIEPFGEATAHRSREELAAVLQEAIGLDVLGAEPQLGAELASWLGDNVSLIKTVPAKFLSDVELRLSRAVREGERWEAVAEMMEERLGVAESNAVRIARDQVGKLYGELNAKRQQDLGITGYIWRTVKDNRVREEHDAREGEHFEFDDPPDEDQYDGNPGTPINCRCWAEPDLGPIFEEANINE